MKCPDKITLILAHIGSSVSIRYSTYVEEPVWRRKGRPFIPIDALPAHGVLRGRGEANEGREDFRETMGDVARNYRLFV